jgi:hypothetical protein
MLNGGDAIVLLDPVLMENGLNPIVNTIRATPDQIQDGPHGMWPCSPGYGNLFLAGNMFSNTISLWDLDAGVLADWVSTGGVMPMNPHVLAGFGGGCRRAFANNFQTNDVSFFDIDPVAKKVSRIPLTGPLANAAGNLALTDLSLTPPRWARSTIQGVASPQDSTTHGQWLFMSSKGYMGEFAIKLDNEGLPIQVYSLPVGLGAHGIAFVRKKTCRTNDPADVCYLVALAGSWADHVEFYDMEALETDLGAPGSAPDSVHVEGYLVEQWCSSRVAQLLALGIDCTSLPAGPYGRIINKLPLTVLCPDCRSGAHVGDVLLQKTTNNSYAYFKSPLIEYWSDGSGGVDDPVDLELLTNSGTFNLAASPTVYAPFK